MPAHAFEFGGPGPAGDGVLSPCSDIEVRHLLLPVPDVLTLGAVEAIATTAPTLKATFLPNMVSGRWTGTMNLTEPQAGTPTWPPSHQGRTPRAMAPTPSPAPRSSSPGVSTTCGEHHPPGWPACRTPPGVKGISLFIAPKYPGQCRWRPGRATTVCASIGHKMGIHGSATPSCPSTKGGAIGYLVGEPKPRPRVHVLMMNHARLKCRPRRRRRLPSGLPARAGLRP